MARYIGTRGTERLQSCVFIESLAPSFVKSDDNPKGVDEAGGRRRPAGDPATTVRRG